MKQLDIASIASYLLQQPTPFSSLGIMHPIFADSVDIMPNQMLENLKQMHTYILEYCTQSPQLSWCENEIEDFEVQI